MGARSGGYRREERNGKFRWVIDFRYLDKDRREQRFRQQAKLQTSDHFYWMSTKGGTDGGVPSYFSPYGTPYDAYIYFMNALGDLQIRLKRLKDKQAAPEASSRRGARVLPTQETRAP